MYNNFSIINIYYYLYINYYFVLFQEREIEVGGTEADSTADIDFQSEADSVQVEKK